MRGSDNVAKVCQPLVSWEIARVRLTGPKAFEHDLSRTDQVPERHNSKSLVDSIAFMWGRKEEEEEGRENIGYGISIIGKVPRIWPHRRRSRAR